MSGPLLEGTAKEETMNPQVALRRLTAIAALGVALGGCTVSGIDEQPPPPNEAAQEVATFSSMAHHLLGMVTNTIVASRFQYAPPTNDVAALSRQTLERARDVVTEQAAEDWLTHHGEQEQGLMNLIAGYVRANCEQEPVDISCDPAQLASKQPQADSIQKDALALYDSYAAVTDGDARKRLTYAQHIQLVAAQRLAFLAEYNALDIMLGKSESEILDSRDRLCSSAGTYYQVASELEAAFDTQFEPRVRVVSQGVTVTIHGESTGHRTYRGCYDGTEHDPNRLTCGELTRRCSRDSTDAPDPQDGGAQNGDDAPWICEGASEEELKADALLKRTSDNVLKSVLGEHFNANRDAFERIAQCMDLPDHGAPGSG